MSGGIQVNEAMLIIKALDHDACVRFSEYTEKWFVSARIEVGGDGLLTSVSPHADSPDLAVLMMWRDLTAIDIHSIGYLVTHAYSGNRREWRWNGKAFTEIPASAEVAS